MILSKGVGICSVYQSPVTADIDEDVIDKYMKCIRNERFFSIHGFKYLQQLIDVMNK